MRGELPGKQVEEKKKVNTEVHLFDENDLLYDKKHTCPVCNRDFMTKTLKTGKAKTVGMDIDMRQRYANIDPIKYRIIECPVCGYADMDTTFENVGRKERSALREKCIKLYNSVPVTEGAREYDIAYRYYKSAIRCDLIRGAKSGKRAYTALYTAWLLRGWREMLTEMGEEIHEADPMNEAEERKLLKYVYSNFKEAEIHEEFPINGLSEEVFDIVMAAIAYKLDIKNEAGQYVLRAIHAKTLKGVLRNHAENLMDMIKNSEK